MDIKLISTLMACWKKLWKLERVGQDEAAWSTAEELHCSNGNSGSSRFKQDGQNSSCELFLTKINFNQKSINLLNLTTSLPKIQRTKNTMKTARGYNQQIQHEGNSSSQSSGFPPLTYKEKQKKEKIYILKFSVYTFWPRWRNRDQTSPHPWNILKNKQNVWNNDLPHNTHNWQKTANPEDGKHDKPSNCPSELL